MSKQSDPTIAGLPSHEVFRLLVESVHDYAIFLLDPTGRVATWNRGAERIKGYTASEIIGHHFSRFYPEAEVRAGKCEHELEVAGRVGRFEDEGWRVRKDGTRFWANVVISAVRDGDGVLVGFSKVTRDLTERRRAEAEQAARQVAEQASRAKDEFLAMLGHELRNPMAPILTALQLMKLRGEAGTREQEVIERQVNHMMRLVDDLLDISRITRGKVALKPVLLDLRDIVAKAVEVASPLLEQRAHHLSIEAPPSPVMVHGDEARLTQVFSNLLTNAAKYTDSGGHVTVSVHAFAGDEAVVEVRDDGAGIDPALLPHIFELFVQGGQGAERASGGLGIGLSLVRSLVELHHGRVEAQSRGRGHGSTFTVHLPAVAAPEAPVVAREVSRPKRVGRAVRILLVDDNDDARELLVEALAAVGHQVRGAADPVEALELLDTFAPEIAVLDIGLPVMDGYELATRIRAQLGAATPRLVALTGYGQPEDAARSRQAGFDVHLVKPIDVWRLLDTIAKLA